jgi:glycosyltransferase involved in cell wall biosynthesis
MSSLRVASITYDWYPFDPRVRRLAEAAVDAGYEYDVICLRQPHEQRYEVCNGVRIYRLPMDRGFGRPLPLTILAWCRFLMLAGALVTWLHLKHAYDVINVHNMPDFLVFSALFPRLFGARVILDVMDVSPELMMAKAKGRGRTLATRLAIWQERISTSFADHIVTAGRPFEERLLLRGVPPEKLTIILNSADPKLFPPSRQVHPRPASSSEEEPFILMYHGTLSERNGLDIALRAFAQAYRDAPRLRLDIQGRGEHLPVLQQLAVELGVGDRVRFTDPCPSEEIVDFVVHGDVGIIPYRLDGFQDLVLPTKAYEFAWMRRPMIASDTPAIRSLFRSESIILCDPSKPEEFARAILDLYHHPEKCVRMVDLAAADYMPYRWENMAAHYQQLLRSLGKKQKKASVSVRQSRQGM